MPDVKSKLIEILYLIEERPGMLFPKRDFQYTDLKNFLMGYLMCLDDVSSSSYNIDFSKWLSNKTSLLWTEYIYILANEDDKKAIDILLNEFKGFVDSL